MRPKDAADLMAIYEVLEDPHSSPRLAWAAIVELERCDIWAKVYALPKLIRLARAERTGQMRGRVDNFVRVMIDADENLLRSLVLSAIRTDNQSNEATISNIEKTADRVGRANRRVDEAVPYLGLPGLIAETLLLSCLAVLADNPDVSATLIQHTKDNMCPALHAFLKKARDGSLGRLAALQAATVSQILDSEGVGRDLAFKLVALPESAGLMEPDIAEMCASLEIWRTADATGQARAACIEFESRTQFEVLRRASRYSREIAEQVIHRWGGVEGHPKRIEHINWEVALVCCSGSPVSAVLGELAAQRWSSPSHVSAKLRREPGEFEGLNDPVKTWRLAVSSVLGLRLASNLGTESSVRNQLLVLAAHAEAVYATKDLNKWLQFAGQPDSRKRENPALPTPVTTMALFSRLAIKDLAMNNSRLAPEAWVDAAESAPWMLPVLVRWIEGLVMAAPDDVSVRRWQAALPEILHSSGKMTKVDGWESAERLAGVLLGKLRCAVAVPIVDLQPRWQDILSADALAKSTIRWTLVRRIIASPLPSGRDWLAYTWMIRDPSVQPAVRLAAAVERFLSNDDDETRSLRDEWQRDLANELANIFLPEELDRWVRHRLLDVVLHAQGGQAGKLATQITIQLGQPSDVARMVSGLLSEITPCPSDLEWKLNHVAEGLAVRGMTEQQGQALRTRACSPRIALRAHSDIDYWFIQSATILAFSPVGTTSLRQRFCEIRRRQAGLHRPAVLRSEAVEEYRGRAVLTLRGEEKTVYSWMIEQVVEDPGQGSFTILYSRYWLQDVHGSKQLPEVTIGNSKDGSVPTVNAHTSEWRGWRNAAHTSSNSFPIGSVVLPEGNNKIEIIKRMPVEGGLYPASGWRLPDGSANFEVGGNVLNPCLKPQWQLWDADESRQLNPVSTDRWKHLVVIRESRGWKPFRQRINDLIAQNGGATLPFSATLTLVAVESDSLGGETWLFSSSPGSLFELGPGLFTPEAAKTLQQRIDQAKGAITGLRVTVTAAKEIDTGQLVLTFSKADVDDRNLKWRGLFRPGGIKSATWSDDEKRNEFIVRTGMSHPYPEVVSVQWDGPIPNRREQQVIGVVTSWEDDDRRKKQLRMARVDAIKLRPMDGDYAKLHSYILTLDTGEIVTLTRAFGRGHEQGNVLALTPEQLGLQVAAESLSLIPDDGNPLIQHDSPRRARITRVVWQSHSDVSLKISSEDVAKLGSGEHLGIVLETPNRDADHGACQVLFVNGNEPVIIVALLVSNNAPRLGSKVHVSNSTGRTQLKVEEISIFAEALFATKRVDEPPASALFVGHYKDHLLRFQAWMDPKDRSNLLLTGASAKDSPRLFESWSHSRALGIAVPPWPWEPVVNVSPLPIKDFDHFRTDVNLRITLTDESRDDEESVLLPGWCPGLSPVSHYEVSNVELYATPYGKALHGVRRVFVGSRCEEVEEEEEEEPEIATRPDRDTELSRLYEKGQPLEASVLVPSDDTLSTWRVLIKSLQNQRFGNNQSMLVVQREELHHFPQVREIRYDRQNAKVMLIHELGQWQASFRRVPPESIESFQDWSRVAVGATFRPPSLIFIGKGDDQSDASCRFEFGFGLLIEAPEDRVLINGQSMSRLKTVIFHGDRVKALRFSKQPSGELGIEIMGVDIALGDPHRVFLQASNHRFVHTLVMEPGNDDRPNVIAIKGFSEGGDRSQQQFAIPYASLAPDSLEGWQERLQRAESRQLSVYARLDVERFLETAGRICEFHQVAFSFGTDQGLRNGDRLLVEAGVMNRTLSGNDIRLALNPLSGVVPLSDRPASLIVLRREFSARESSLGRFLSHNEDVSAALQGMVFAVYIRTASEDRGGQASLLEMPSRRWGALLGALHSSSGPIFAVAANIPGNGTDLVARVEVRPGVFFDLKSDHLDCALPAGLAAGTLVRLELAASQGTPEQIRLVPCQFSHWRYLSQTHARPSVALPIDALIKDGASTHAWNWSGIELFTACDFPAVKFSADRAECWGDHLHLRGIMPEFMALPHPKLAWLRRTKGNDGRDRAVLFPAEGYIKAGSLRWENGNVWMVQSNGGDVSVHWHLLSFADISITEIEDRCSRRQWFIHDKETGQWTNRGINRTTIGGLSVFTGPLFFDGRLNEHRLRYGSSELSIFGVPLGNIADSFGLGGLDSRGICVEVTVASIEEGDGTFEGIWVEWVSGRVIELPVEMLTWRSGPELLPLESFDWSHLATGDELELRIVAGEALAPDRIEVVAWRRGPRGCCIPPPESAALMPCAEPGKMGGLRLGAGAFQLTLPIPQSNSAQSYWLPESNLAEPFSNQQLRPGDIVLIHVEKADFVSKLMVMGLSGIEALPDERDHSRIIWNKHPLAESLIRRGADQRRGFHLPAFVDLIQAAGGALPVTVEGIDKKNRIVWFSFRYQSPSMKAEGIAQAIVLGATLDLSRASLWLGNGVCFVYMQDIVDGLSERLRAIIVREMVTLRIPVWVKSCNERDIKLRIGLCDDSPGDLWVVPVAAIGNGQDVGLLVRSCKSQRLYWIPQEHLAWTDLTSDEIRESFCDTPTQKDKALRASLRLGRDDSAKLSLLHTAESRREQDDLHPGHELRVVVVARTLGPNQTDFHYWLVRSLETGLLLRCDVPVGLEWRVGETNPVEIVSRRLAQTHRMTCAPQGHRTIPTTLPQAVFQQLTCIATRANPLPWRDELRLCSQLSTEKLLHGLVKDSPLNIRLVWAWELCVKRSSFAAYASEAALTWIKLHSNSSVSFLSEALMASSILCTLVAAGPSRILVPPLHKDEVSECLSQWWTRVFAMLGQLQGRILRSLHLAILMSRLTREELESDKRFAAMYQRLLRLLSAPLFPRNRAELLRLADQLLMDMGENRHEFAGALMSCLGITPPAQAIRNSNNLTDPVRDLEKLASVCAPFVSGLPKDRNREQESLLAGKIADCLNDSLAVCSNQSWDMVLLGELAPILIASFTEGGSRTI